MADLRKITSGSLPRVNVSRKVSVQGKVFILLCIILAEPGGATTHWVVTEDGKIQQQVDSPLNLKHPHDLVIFMRQETRVNYLKKLEKQLVAQKIHIEENEDRDTGLEQRHYKEDADCVTAKVPLGDLDLYDGTYISLESKDISPEDYVDFNSPLPPDLEKPDCARVFELPYSVHGFQHLRGVQERVNLTSPLLSKEDPIFGSLSHKLGRSMDEVGHRIHQGLLRNSSSWVLYNLASFYWRIKNEPRRAVDCVVRALHFSPRQHKDLSLVNMANILHRAHFSADAAIVAHAALDLTSDLLTSHYTLGNIYAVSYSTTSRCTEYNPGDDTLKRFHLFPSWFLMEYTQDKQNHRNLARTLNELKEYQKQHDHYLRQQEALDKYKLLQEEQILRNIIHETQMAKEAQLGNHQMCRLGQQQSSLFCPLDLPVRYHRGDLFEHIHYIQFGEEVSVAASVALVSEPSTNQTTSPHLHPSVSGDPEPAALWGHQASPTEDIQRLLWPRRADCADEFPVIPPAHLLPTFYLPPETQGPRLVLDTGPQVSVLDTGPRVSALDAGPRVSALDAGPRVLLSRNNVHPPLLQASAPGWLLQNEAALFWRAKGNGTSSLQCLRHSLASAPPTQRHLPLVNAANLLLRHGLSAHARTLLEDALALNASEVHTFEILYLNTEITLHSRRIETFQRSLYAWTLKDTVSTLFSKQPGCLENSLFLALCFALVLGRPVVLDSNGSGETGQQPGGGGGGGERDEEEWQLKEELMGAFEGALDVGGKRGNLRGIRVLKNDRVMGAGRSGGGPCFGNCEDDEGAEWITFQVKRVRKPKADSPEGWGSAEDTLQGETLLPGGHSVLEISGPTIPSPGPSGRWRDYTSLGWPGPEECQRTRRVDLTTVASTWLAVSAKNIDITEHIDFATPLQEPAVEPLCNANLAASMHTLDHLAGVANRAAIHYTGESQLREVLQNLGKDKFSPQSFEQVGTRIAKVLEKNQTSWVLSSMSALYWRVKGQGKRAIDCLRQALHYAPHHMKDVPLISLANIFQNARLWEDALTVARMAVEIAPHFVVNHFTLANVYIAMEEFEKAMRWYESTLELQPEFAPAKDRLRTIQCYLLTKKDRRLP
uniref:Tetratricopeptide repeat domain 17 n=2 Tax=Hucho hucho TaxID=62062 RepID=A0A4W5PYF8_9TELE